MPRCSKSRRHFAKLTGRTPTRAVEPLEVYVRLPGVLRSYGRLEKLVMDYATAITRTPAEVPDAPFTQLRRHLDELELIELTHHIAL